MDHTRRTALLSAAALCLVLGGLFWLAVREDTPVPAAAPAAVAASTDNWGLSFQTEGEPPVGNATAQSLAQYDAYYVGDTTQKVLYLTFDCGYENGYTAQILDVLKDHQAPAAFFVVGHMIQSSPDLIRRMVQEGHIVGNHTFHHPDISAGAGGAGTAVPGDHRPDPPPVLPPSAGKIQRGESAPGPGPGLPHRVLEPGLCGLVRG